MNEAGGLRQLELRKSDSGLKNCKLPSDLVFSGMKRNAVIRLERSGNNMQTDAGAVDAWALALHSYCGVERGIRIEADSPKPEDASMSPGSSIGCRVSGNCFP